MTLAEYLQTHDIRPAEFARMVSVPRQYVSRWMSGISAPRPIHMQRIIQATSGSVTAHDFMLASLAKPSPSRNEAA